MLRLAFEMHPSLFLLARYYKNRVSESVIDAFVCED